MDDEKDEKRYNQSQHMEQLLVCSEGLNHQEEDHDCKYLSFYSCLSISESLCQEGSISLDSFEDQNNNYFETHEENQVLNSKISNEVVDVSFESCHEHTLYGSSENQFDIFQVTLQFENPCHNKKIA